MIDQNQFVEAYSTLVWRVWTDEIGRIPLTTHPTRFLGEVGLTVPANATVAVTFQPAAQDSDLQTQFDLWRTGEATQQYELIIPEKPTDFDPDDLGLSELHLDNVIGGTNHSTPQHIFCCCCSTYG